MFSILVDYYNTHSINIAIVQPCYSPSLETGNDTVTNLLSVIPYYGIPGFDAYVLLYEVVFCYLNIKNNDSKKVFY